MHEPAGFYVCGKIYLALTAYVLQREGAEWEQTRVGWTAKWIEKVHYEDDFPLSAQVNKLNEIKSRIVSA